MDKLKMHSPDLIAANIARIAEFFPNCVTETKTETGELKPTIDFDLLRQELSDHIVEGPQERYRIDWPGKREALLAANAPIAKTLRPCREESVDFDKTRNLLIEGDNLDALKLLQENYLNKVKMIYIDPPYNTGKEFLYNDDFSESSLDYLLRSDQTDDQGSRMIANTDANGRFHSDWLSMIYPRLKLARNLLSEDGAIFITIDESEAANLKRICDEVLGESSFLGSITWKKRSSPDARATVGSIHDNILCYVKDGARPKSAVSKMPLTETRKAAFSNPDNDPRGPWASVDMTGMIGRATKEQFFEVELPSGRLVRPPEGRSWGLAEATFKRLREDNRIWFGATGDNVPRIKNFLSESEGQVVPSIWEMQDVGSNDDASSELTELFGAPKIFDTPKPTSLIIRMLQIATNPDSLVIDFFAGSGTTLHSVFSLNAQDQGTRRCILVQLPEPCREETQATRSGFNNIAEITKTRIKAAGKKVKDANLTTAPNLDIGFRVLKIDSSNMRDVYYAPDDVKQQDLLSQTDNIKQDRSPEDLLFQVLLDWGVDLTLPISNEKIEKKTVFFVDETALAACFETGVSEPLVKAIAQRQPLRVVFRDAGFADDSIRINVEEIFRLLSPSTEVKTI